MKPILFSVPMVQAILTGRKTQTRRVIKPQTVTHNTPGGLMTNSLDDFMRENRADAELLAAACAPYQPGDILWVRETWKELFPGMKAATGLTAYVYKADAYEGARTENAGFKPSIHMPREAARIFLRVTSVRAERVQDITPLDAWNEGCRIGNSFPWEQHIPELQQQCRDIVFRGLWDHLNAKRGYGWATNPWVWVVEFERYGGET